MIHPLLALLRFLPLLGRIDVSNPPEPEFTNAKASANLLERDDESVADTAGHPVKPCRIPVHQNQPHDFTLKILFIQKL